MKKFAAALILILAACGQPREKKETTKVPVVGFLDFLQDETLAEAKKRIFYCPQRQRI